MKRPVAVSTIALLLILVSSFAALMSALMVFVHSFNSSTAEEPPFALASMIFTAILFLCGAVWGLVTAAGLFQMRPWARISILVISSLLVFFCATSLAIILRLFQRVPGIIIVIYMVPVALGIWWLVYFNRTSVKGAFLLGSPTEAKPRRPLSIAVIAWHGVVFGITTMPFALFNLPAYINGTVVTGWAAQLTYLVIGATELAIGIGLLKLKPWAHTAAVWFSLFVMAQAALWAFLPDKAGPMEEILKYYPPEIRMQASVNLDAFYWFGAVITWATFATALWYLLTRKKAFLEAGIFSSQNAHR